MRALDRDGETWVADVHCDQMVYLEDPDPIVPERRNFKGRAPSRLVAQTKAVRVDKWVAAQPEADWKKVVIRESTKGLCPLRFAIVEFGSGMGKNPAPNTGISSCAAK